MYWHWQRMTNFAKIPGFTKDMLSKITTADLLKSKRFIRLTQKYKYKVKENLQPWLHISCCIQPQNACMWSRFSRAFCGYLIWKRGSSLISKQAWNMMRHALSFSTTADDKWRKKSNVINLCSSFTHGYQPTPDWLMRIYCEPPKHDIIS